MKIIKDENCYGSFSLSNLFVEDYLTTLGGDAVKLYIYLCWLYEMHRDTTESAILAVLKMTSDRLRVAADELVRTGLITVNDGSLMLNDIVLQKLMKKSGLSGYGASSWNCDENKTTGSELAEVINTVQRDYFGGQMTRQWYELIRRLSNKLEPEVILLLFAHCEQYSDKPLKKAYVEKVAENWIAENIKNTADLEEYLSVRTVLMRLVDFIKKKMNRSAPFMDSEIATIRKWRFEYGYGENELSVVLAWTKFNNPTIGAFDKILTAWHMLGLANADEIKAYLEKNQKSDSGKTDPKDADRNQKSAGRTSSRANFTQREYTEDFYAGLLSGKQGGGDAVPGDGKNTEG